MAMRLSNPRTFRSAMRNVSQKLTGEGIRSMSCTLIGNKRKMATFLADRLRNMHWMAMRCGMSVWNDPVTTGIRIGVWTCRPCRADPKNRGC